MARIAFQLAREIGVRDFDQSLVRLMSEAAVVSWLLRHRRRRRWFIRLLAARGERIQRHRAQSQTAKRERDFYSLQQGRFGHFNFFNEDISVLKSGAGSTPGVCARVSDPPRQRDHVLRNPTAALWEYSPRVELSLFHGMTTLAGRDWSFGVRLLLVAVNLVAFDAASLVLPASGYAVISILHVNFAALTRRVRVINFLVTSDALEHRLHARVFVGVMTILATGRIRRLRMIAVVKVFDDAPFGVLSPMRTLLRIA